MKQSGENVILIRMQLDLWLAAAGSRRSRTGKSSGSAHLFLHVFQQKPFSRLVSQSVSEALRVFSFSSVFLGWV